MISLIFSKNMYKIMILIFCSFFILCMYFFLLKMILICLLFFEQPMIFFLDKLKSKKKNDFNLSKIENFSSTVSPWPFKISDSAKGNLFSSSIFVSLSLSLLILVHSLHLSFLNLRLTFSIVDPWIHFSGETIKELYTKIWVFFRWSVLVLS